MKKNHLTVFTLSVTSMITVTSARITYVNTGFTTTTANNIFVATADPTQVVGTNYDGMTSMGTYEGITATMSSTVDGGWNAGGNSLTFQNSSPILSGATVTFIADFNMILTGALPAGAGVNRAAASFRAAGANVDSDVDITLTGGNDSLYNYYVNNGTASALAVGDTSYFPFPTAGSPGSFDNGGTTATVTSIPTLASPNTFSFDEGSDPTGQLAVEIYGPYHQPTQFSFQNIEFEFTNNGTDLPANTFFLFTFEGNNPAEQLALIPEPSSGLLGAFGLGSIAFSRKRRRAKN